MSLAYRRQLKAFNEALPARQLKLAGVIGKELPLSFNFNVEPFEVPNDNEGRTADVINITYFVGAIGSSAWTTLEGAFTDIAKDDLGKEALQEFTGGIIVNSFAVDEKHLEKQNKIEYGKVVLEPSSSFGFYARKEGNSLVLEMYHSVADPNIRSCSTYNSNHLKTVIEAIL